MNLNLVLAAGLLFAIQVTTGATSVPFFMADLIAIGLLAVALIRAFGGMVKNFVPLAWIGVLAIILFSVMVPTMTLISLRQGSGPAAYVHDNPIQIEEAIRFLRQGKNPYRENYTSTPLMEWSHGMIAGRPNPALFHVIALPGHLLLSFVSYFPFKWLAGYYDERMLYPAVYVILIVLASRLGVSASQRLRSVILLGLNPFIIPFLIEGRNDILVFTFMLAAALFFRRRPIVSVLFFGLACTMKMFAWLFAPAYLIAVIGSAAGTNFIERLRASIKPILIFLAVTAVIILPFIVWDAPSFFDDIIGYANGTLPTSYPIHGLGFSRILYDARAIGAISDYYPFWIFQLLAVIPLLAIFLPKLYRQPKPSLMVMTGTFTVFLIAYFSRFFNDNYVGFLFLLLITGFGLHLKERDTVKSETKNKTSSAV